MDPIITINQLIVKHEFHICKLPDSCPDYGKHIFMFKIGDQSTFIKGDEIEKLITVLQGCK